MNEQCSLATLEPSSTRISLKRKTTIETRKKNCCQQVPGSSNKMILYKCKLIVRYCKLYGIDHKMPLKLSSTSLTGTTPTSTASLPFKSANSFVTVKICQICQSLAATCNYVNYQAKENHFNTSSIFSSQRRIPLPRKEWNVEPENHKRQVWGHCSQPPHLPKGLAWKVEPFKMQESSRSTRIS